MPESLLIGDDGYLRTHPDGWLVTDKNGAPCCCGSGCCFCADHYAKDDEPCYAQGSARGCGPEKCCCGKLWEFSTSGTIDLYQEVYQERIVTANYDFLVRVRVVPDPVWKCRLEWDFLKSRYEAVINGQPVVKDPFTGFYNVNSLFRFYWCRATAESAAKYANTLAIDYLGAISGPGGYDLGCDYELDLGYQYSRFTGGGDCNGGSWAWHFHWYENFVENMSGKWAIKRLDSACCGDGGGDGPRATSAAPNLNPPGNPPGAPGGVGGIQGDGGCPRCGGGIRSDGKCSVCAYCGGCGGH